MTRECPECHKAVFFQDGDISRFCPYCGTGFEIKGTPPAAHTIVCPHCKKEIKGNAEKIPAFCPYCGENLSISNFRGSPQSKEENLPPKNVFFPWLSKQFLTKLLLNGISAILAGIISAVLFVVVVEYLLQQFGLKQLPAVKKLFSLLGLFVIFPIIRKLFSSIITENPDSQATEKLNVSHKSEGEIMSSKQIECPNCHQPLEADTEWEGMEVQCPRCTKNFIVHCKENVESFPPLQSETISSWNGMKLFWTCKKCHTKHEIQAGKKILFCPACGARDTTGENPAKTTNHEDSLSTAGKIATVLSLFLASFFWRPAFPISALVIGIIYYSIRKEHPKKASQLNKISWIAWGLAFLAQIIFFTTR